ncbi:MAG: FlgD immunoglobulin-like domain containing protein, partial [Candidatus Latescibacterota bacterium]
LYVANTGHNEIRRYELTSNGARFTDAVGGLGSGDGRFAGPMAITVGHTEGVHNDDIYVSDAHNGRFVLLHDSDGKLGWAGSMAHGMGAVTSLDTDHWGNVYAASPQAGQVAKFTSSLLAVATYSGGVNRPRSFHVPFANVTDHRTGTKQRMGQGSGIVVEEWDRDSGIRLLNLGVELQNAAPVENENAVGITLTDHASVTATITDPADGHVVARRDAGVLAAGPQTIRFSEDDYVSAWEAGDYVVKIEARSTYDDTRTSKTQTTVAMSGSGGAAVPHRLELLGNSPNPFNPSTTIRFSVPGGPTRPYSLRVYDVSGRLVKRLAEGQVGGGLKEVFWNGQNDAGQPVGSGIYLYRLTVGRDSFTGKMVLVK